MWANRTGQPPSPGVLFFSHPYVDAALNLGAASRYRGAIWRSLDGGGRHWTPMLELTGDCSLNKTHPCRATKDEPSNLNQPPVNMFAYSVLATLAAPSGSTLPMGVLYETGDGGKSETLPQSAACR